ncbi:innexin inx2 [Lepeophtheirus salmonis]|uniref:innexin inx2 n=1 Tax=Lepeophtheirus salmonis TaxID=72036 RepID=UPI001AE4C8C9|nr:innexin inx2-like [Lepeophtheirus salmonis]
MIGNFDSLKNLLKRREKPTLERWVNKLHYRATTSLLLGSCILVTTIEWVGNDSRISCIMEGPDDSWTIPANVINTYCYIMTTFTLPKHYNSRVGHDSLAPGVGSYNWDTGDESYRAYYQWVPFVLFFQAILFYIPHSLFKIWEGGKVTSIMIGLNNLVLDKDDRETRQKLLANYLVESVNTHNLWAWKMLLVDFLNVVNLIFNIYFVDVFLGGEFSAYGTRVIEFLEADPEKRIDPMSVVFPRVTKCTFFKYGPSGSMQRHDSLCVLPINIVNEKIYVFLWFWFLALSIVTILGMFYHLVVTRSSGITKALILYRSMNKESNKLDSIGENYQIGDWKLLFIISQNMEPIVFCELIKNLHMAFLLKKRENILEK